MCSKDDWQLFQIYPTEFRYHFVTGKKTDTPPLKPEENPKNSLRVEILHRTSWKSFIQSGNNCYYFFYCQRIIFVDYLGNGSEIRGDQDLRRMGIPMVSNLNDHLGMWTLSYRWEPRLLKTVQKTIVSHFKGMLGIVQPLSQRIFAQFHNRERNIHTYIAVVVTVGLSWRINAEVIVTIFWEVLCIRIKPHTTCRFHSESSAPDLVHRWIYRAFITSNLPGTEGIRSECDLQCQVRSLYNSPEECSAKRRDLIYFQNKSNEQSTKIFLQIDDHF